MTGITWALDTWFIVLNVANKKIAIYNVYLCIVPIVLTTFSIRYRDIMNIFAFTLQKLTAMVLKVAKSCWQRYNRMKIQFSKLQIYWRKNRWNAELHAELYSSKNCSLNIYVFIFINDWPQSEDLRNQFCSRCPISLFFWRRLMSK